MSLSGDEPARAEAEAAAERLMAACRMQQEVDTLHARRDAVGSQALVIGAAALFGAFAGGMVGALRGHPAVGAVMFGLLGAVLAGARAHAPGRR